MNSANKGFVKKNKYINFIEGFAGTIVETNHFKQLKLIS